MNTRGGWRTSLAVVAIPLLILFAGLLVLQVSSARAAAVASEIERVHARIDSVVGSGITSLGGKTSPTAGPETSSAPAESPGSPSTTPGRGQPPSETPGRGAQPTETPGSKGEASSTPLSLAPARDASESPAAVSPTVGLGAAGGNSGSVTAAEIAEALWDRDSFVWVLDPTGAVLTKLDAGSGRALPENLAGPNPGQREVVLASGKPVDEVRGEWLMVVAPIKSSAAGAADPIGLVGLATPIDHTAAAAAASLGTLPIAAVLLLAALGLGVFLGRRRPSALEAPNMDQSTVVAAAPTPVQAASTVAEDRDAMVRALIEVRDQVTSVTLGDLLDRALASSGVVPVSGDGEPFDASRHHAVGSVPTDDPQLHDRVASTERPGYSDRGRLVRPPHVLVYQFSAVPK